MTEKRPPSFFLPGRLFSRWASYLSDIQDLTLQGTAEPRRWIGCVEELWLNVASDHADWLREIGYGDEPLVGGGFPATQDHWINPDHPVAGVPLEVPASVFERLETDEVAVYPSPLEARGTVVAFPGTNLRMEPANVLRTDRGTDLRVFDLPALQPGMELRGVIWAAKASQGTSRPAPLVIASVCLRAR